jgi:hypothetical protein
VKRKKLKGAKRWTKAQADAYTRHVKTQPPMVGTILHITKCYHCAKPLKDARSDILCPSCRQEVKDETVRSDVQSERAEG